MIDVYDSSNSFTRIVSVYRPPNTTSAQTKTMCIRLKKYLNVVRYCITGDLNLGDIDWAKMTSKTPSAREFLVLCMEICANQKIIENTRKDKILDVLLIPDSVDLADVEIIEPFSTSDHAGILFDIRFDRKPVVIEPIVPDFRTADYKIINSYLITLDWDKIMAKCVCVEDYWLTLRCVLDMIVTQFVPKRHTKRSIHPWVNLNLKRIQRSKQSLYRNFCKQNNENNYLNYQRCARYYKKEFLFAKTEYEKRLFNDKCKLKTFYAYLKNQLKCKCDVPPIKSCNGLVDGNKNKAELFSDYFAKHFTLDNGHIPDYAIKNTDSISIFKCDAKSIVKIVSKMRGGFSLDPQYYCMFFVKNLIANLAKPLGIIFDKSLSEGTLVNDWKIADIVPVLKSGDPQMCENYRSISLTSVFSKILETIVKDQMLNFLTICDLIPDVQHGFVPKRSTVTNLLSCLDDWTANIENSLQTDVIYLDFAKCFNSVSHQKLLFKLERLGFRGKCLLWLNSFFFERIQRVKINSEYSAPKSVISGTPEGTVIGPLLYVCYSLDLNFVIKYCKLSCFADDSKLYKSITCDNDTLLLQEDLNNVVNWAKSWQLSLNGKKTKLLVIGKCLFERNYDLLCNAIEKVDTIRDLGVIMDSNLSFTVHCKKLVQKAYYVIRNIFMTFKSHTTKFYVNLYKLYVRPILEYACQVWSPELKFNINRIERVQRYFTSRLPNLDSKSYNERLVSTEIESLEHRRLCLDLCFFHQIIHHKTDYVSESFIFKLRLRGNCKNLAVTRCKTNKRQHFYFIRIVNNWNDLSDIIVTCENLKTVKKHLNRVVFNFRGSALN